MEEAEDVVESGGGDLVLHHQEISEFGGDATAEREMVEDEAIAASKPRLQAHVRFDAVSDDDEMPPTATNLTPHPRKATITRRFTQSPAASQRSQGSLRASLPAFWNGSRTSSSRESTTLLKEINYNLLQAAVDSRVQRHKKALRRSTMQLAKLRQEAAEMEGRIAELDVEFEEQKDLALSADDDPAAQARLEELTNELETLRRQHSDFLALHGLVDENMYVLDGQEVAYPELPSTSYGELTLFDGKSSIGNGEAKKRTSSIRESFSLSQMTDAWEAERREFQDAVLALSREAADAKGALNVLKIELDALGFGSGPDVDGKVIIASIRKSFMNIRESIDELLPDTLPDGATTEEVIEILVANLKEFTTRLRQQQTDMYQRDILISDLSRQVNGLLEHLADAKLKYENLSERFTGLDEEQDKLRREMEDLEERLARTEASREYLQQQSEERGEEAKALGRDHAEAIANIESLTISLETYRKEETRLTELIERMEREHAEGIGKIAKERGEAVEDLENRLDTEVRLRGEAERLGDERETEITKLQVQIERLQTERDSLLDEVAQLVADRDAEKASRETAESTLDEKTIEVEDLEGRVDRLEEELTILNEQLADLRSTNETNRIQREAAEKDLDDRNAEIELLNEKLKTTGAEANGLRMKLFEKQHENEKQVKELEQQMSDRDEQYQVDIADEVRRREEADDLAHQRAATILELEQRIEELELLMKNDVQERDERITELEAIVSDRDRTISDLNMDYQSLENELDAAKTQREEREEELQGSIRVLQENISELEEHISELKEQAIRDNDLHNSEIDDRNAEIATLHSQIEILRTTESELEARVAGLERRVEQEAENMLELQTAKDDEIADYRAQLEEKQAKILNVERKAAEADAAWQEVLTAKEEEIASLTKMTQVSEESTATLTLDFEALRAKFRAYVHKTNERFARVRAAAETVRVVAEDEGTQQMGDGERALEEVEGMQLSGRVEASKKTVAAQQSSSSAVKRGRKKGRVVDSGIGIAGREMEEVE